MDAPGERQRRDARGPGLPGSGSGAGREDPFERARRTDPKGHAVHLGLAVLALFGLALATSTKDLLAIPVVVMALLRLHRTAPCYGRLFRDRIFLALVAWAAMLAASLLWSSDAPMGVEHLGAFRVVAVGLAIWPLIRRPSPMIAGFVAGAACQFAVQCFQGAEVLGFEPGENDRLTGLMHPIRTATIMSAACLWCLSAAATSPVGRLPAMIGLLVVALTMAAGVAMTGSRGPWIALAAGGVALAGLLAIRAPGSRRRLAVAGGLAVVAAIALAPFASGFIGSRIQQARADLQEARAGTFDTDVGFRLASYGTALELVRERPLLGHGAGSFWIEAPRVAPELSWEGITHAHSTWLTIAVETGLPSMVFVAGLFVAAAARAWRRALVHPTTPGTFALIVLFMVASLFDAPHHAGTLNGLMQFMLLLVIPPAGERGIEDAGAGS